MKRYILPLIATILLNGCGFLYSLKTADHKSMRDETISLGAMVVAEKHIENTDLLEWKRENQKGAYNGTNNLSK